MRCCSNEEIMELNMMLDDNLDLLGIVKISTQNPKIIDSINQEQALFFDRVISEIFDERLDENSIIGAAFVLGIMQGKIIERKKLRPTHHR